MQKQFIKTYLADDIKNWVEEQSEIMGMSKSAFINLCINQYRQQLDMMKTVNQFDQYLTRLENMVNSQQNNDMYSIRNRVNK